MKHNLFINIVSTETELILVTVENSTKVLVDFLSTNKIGE
jgi:hypothetical protein